MAGARLKVGLDTSYLVPLLAEEHIFHEPTRSEWERLKRQGVIFVVPCHALLECFSVLTRMPPPYRRAPGETERMLHENFARETELPGVASDAVWTCVRELAAAGLGGGDIYDAVIARSSFEAGAAVLLSWNVKDFLRVAPSGLEVLTPTEYAARAPRLH